MMNKLQLFIFLVCICMLAGCTEEEENSGIRLIEGTASGQTVFADETTTDGDIHFTTDGAWTAEVTEASTKAEGTNTCVRAVESNTLVSPREQTWLSSRRITVVRLVQL